MNTKEYYHEVYLKSDEWKETRKQVLEHYDHKCALCGSSEKLNVHHLVYKDYQSGEKDRLEDLICLCENCHMWFHKVKAVEDKEFLRFEADKKQQFKLMFENMYLDWVEECKVKQAEMIVAALQHYKTKHLNKLQSYFSFTAHSYVTEIIKQACTEIEVPKKWVMQYVKEMRTN